MGFHEQHPTATIRCAIRNGPGRIQQHYPTLHLKPAATVKDIVWEISNLKDANLWPFHLSRSIACHHGSCQQYRIKSFTTATSLGLRVISCPRKRIAATMLAATNRAPVGVVSCVNTPDFALASLERNQPQNNDRPTHSTCIRVRTNSGVGDRISPFPCSNCGSRANATITQ
jgi:hypothetical protein